MNDSVNVLIVSKGHDYAHDSFLAMFGAMEGVTATLVEQPAAQVILQPENMAPYDAVFFYDMSGIPGVGLLHDGANNTGIPPESYVRAIEGLLESGKGLVLVNHATVGWPLWPLWRKITGSSFMLSGGELKGRNVPGSGYRGGHGPLPSATIRLVPQAEHPVLAGLEGGFDITDELYLKTKDYESGVLPLLRGDYDFVMENFTPPPMAPADEQASWQHPPGSDLIVWANACGNSPIVVSDVGDSPLAYDDPSYRRLIQNALRWVASADARAWAKQQNNN
ncbi:MAG: ThuA domain-containing protein [Proteobacteria bacterium]|nr:ThuA domain-containing protein [Pseudomonadota bacterium]